MKASQSSEAYILYVRKASIEQVDRKLKTDLRWLQQMAKDRSLLLTAEIVETGSAYRSGMRQGFEQMIRLIETGQANGIVCLSLHVLTRNTTDHARLLMLMHQGKLKEIVTHSGSITNGRKLLAGDARLESASILKSLAHSYEFDPLVYNDKPRFTTQ